MKKKLIIFSLLVLFFTFPVISSARTLNDYKDDLAKLKAEKKEAEDQTQDVQNQINTANSKMADINKQIVDANIEKEQKEVEIKETNIEIENKEEEIKNLVEFYQLSDNENFYLKYIFAAESFEDFIYRFAVVEQLTEANDKLVDEMNALIKANEVAIKELDATMIKLDNLNEELLAEVSKLKGQKSEYMEIYESFDDQISTLNDQIRYFEDQGCKGDEDLSVCVASVPFDYGFNKPLSHGVVTSEYGQRFHPTKHVYTFHNGIDIGGNSEGTPVYAVAAGKVSTVAYKRYCGGTSATINHIVDGKAYTTRYLHLLNMYVEPGDIVTKGQVIGTVGGGSGTPYDHCSTGPHLHFEIIYGHYYGSGIDSYTSYSTYVSKLTNPRNLIFFPNKGIWW